MTRNPCVTSVIILKERGCIIAITKHLTRDNFRGAGCVWACSLRRGVAQSTVVNGRAAGVCDSGSHCIHIEKQREMNAGAQLSFFSVQSRTPKPRCPYSG